MIEYPDVSHYNAPLSLRGAPVVFAKATQGTGYVDPTFGGFRAQARQLGIPLGGYHWLDTSDPVAQARNAFSMVGTLTPLMIDDEQPSINVAHTLAFVTEYRRLGGIVTLEYLPRWTWEASGKPDLRPLAAAGLHLVASDYRPADASYPAGPAWAAYGGVTPTILQYTDGQPFNGRSVDFNVFPGSLEELLAIITGGDMATIDQTDWDALRWRIDAILFNRPTVIGGPTKGERNQLHDAIAALSPAAPTAQLVDQELGKALTAAAAAVTPQPPASPA